MWLFAESAVLRGAFVCTHLIQITSLISFWFSEVELGLKLLRKTLEVKLATSPSKRRFPNSLVRMRSEDSIMAQGKGWHLVRCLYLTPTTWHLFPINLPLLRGMLPGAYDAGSVLVRQREATRKGSAEPGPLTHLCCPEVGFPWTFRTTWPARCLGTYSTPPSQFTCQQHQAWCIWRSKTKPRSLDVLSRGE